MEDFIDEYYVVDGFFLPNLCRFTSFLVNGMERRNSGSFLHKETLEGVSFIKHEGCPE
jgi:hypothetical protein